MCCVTFSVIQVNHSNVCMYVCIYCCGIVMMGDSGIDSVGDCIYVVCMVCWLLVCVLIGDSVIGVYSVYGSDVCGYVKVVWSCIGWWYPCIVGTIVVCIGWW